MSIVIQFLFFAAKASIPFLTEAQYGLMPEELSPRAGTSSAKSRAIGLFYWRRSEVSVLSRE